MRISDWSSDVCSSDLFAIVAAFLPVTDRRAEGDAVFVPHGEQGDLVIEVDERLGDDAQPVAAHPGGGIIARGVDRGGVSDRAPPPARRGRAEERDEGRESVSTW